MNKNEFMQFMAEQTTDKILSELKNGRKTSAAESWDAYKLQYEPKGHNVSNPRVREDKIIKTDSGDKPVKVARIALPVQKLIVKRAVAFLFGNEPEMAADLDNNVLETINSVFHDCRINTINREVARTLFTNREVAEYWYVDAEDEESRRYGFDTPLRLRCAIFSPENGDELFPYFNDNGDMVAFSRQYTKTRGDKKTYFETYTKDAIFKWCIDKTNTELCEGYPKANPLNKIPVIYAEQPAVEWADVQPLIERLEYLLSNFADTNDYHASPKILVNGQIISWAEKGESGAVIEMAEGATAQYLTWSQAPESIKLEIETLTKMIYTGTQTPDISFETAKSLGGISGVALKLLFMDSHLKVQDKREIFDEYLQRRINVVKSYLAQMNPESQFVNDCKNTIITATIKPYTLSDISTELQQLQSANGNQAVISHLTSIKMAGALMHTNTDPNEEYKAIKDEDSEKNDTLLGL